MQQIGAAVRVRREFARRPTNGQEAADETVNAGADLLLQARAAVLNGNLRQRPHAQPHRPGMALLDPGRRSRHRNIPGDPAIPDAMRPAGVGARPIRSQLLGVGFLPVKLLVEAPLLRRWVGARDGDPVYQPQHSVSEDERPDRAQNVGNELFEEKRAAAKE